MFNLLQPWKAGAVELGTGHDLFGSNLLGPRSLRGQYYPLAGSRSYPSKPGGMSMDEEKVRLCYIFL